MYTLVVVDMQREFNSANGNRVRKGCRRLIDKAIEDDAHIVFLEYWGCGRTLSDLTESLHGKCVFRTKDQDDGSAEVEAEAILGRMPKHFRVCGVNTDCCVLSTVRGLTSRFPMSTIEVMIDACDSDWSHVGGIEKLKGLGGYVRVIDSEV